MTCSSAVSNSLDDYSFRISIDTHTQEPAEVVAVPAAVKKDLPVDGTLPSTAPPAQVQAQAQKEVLPTESQAQSNVLPTESLLPSSTAPISSAPISNNAFASGANMNGAQVMTGRSSSRVLAPPGGHTSWTLG
jgi:hypothetical protein